MKPVNNLTSYQRQIVFTAVRKYQFDHLSDVALYKECHEILNELYDFTYTQQREQER